MLFILSTLETFPNRNLSDRRPELIFDDHMQPEKQTISLSLPTSGSYAQFGGVYASL